MSDWTAGFLSPDKEGQNNWLPNRAELSLATAKQSSLALKVFGQMHNLLAVGFLRVIAMLEIIGSQTMGFFKVDKMKKWGIDYRRRQCTNIIQYILK